MRAMAERLRLWGDGFRPRNLPYGRLALTFAIGLVGAGIFLFLRLPLPWMLGPMVISLAVALAGLPVIMPQTMRSPMLVVLGVMVGASVTPELVTRMPEWLLPLAGLAVVMVAGTAAGYFYFRRVAGYDRPTSYFSSVPGGLTEMVLQSESSGGDSRMVALSHAMRVSIVVLAVPFLVQFITGTTLGARPAAGLPLLELRAMDVAWFVVTCLFGAALSMATTSATGLFLAPLFVSAILHGSGLATFVIPREIGIFAQIVMGLSLGCRFLGMHIRVVGISALWSIGACVVLLATSCVFALLAAWLTGENIIALLLAYSPAGVAEMSLVAVALQIEVAFVVVHHLVRLLLVTAFASRLYGRRKD